MKSMKNIISGLIVSIALTITFILAFSLILAKTNFSEKYIDVIIVIISGVCMLIGTIISTRKIKKNGALNGVIMALLYVIVLYVISSIITNNFLLNNKSIFMIIVTIMLGGVGGMVGVNIK